MQITRIEETPFHELPYRNARSGGGTERRRLPFLDAVVDELPNGLEALIAVADLQGIARASSAGGTWRLLGIALVDAWIALARDGLVPRARSVGVILAGDFYSDRDASERGATGDVRAVWKAFAEHFRFVAGVAGNHDSFGTDRERRHLAKRKNVFLLDGERCAPDGLVLGGVSGIIGNPRKNGRKTEEAFLDAIRDVVIPVPDLLVLHQGPGGEERSLRGHEGVRQVVSEEGVGLTVCGHCHWPRPLATLASGVQVLNVDARVVVIRAE